MTQEYHKNLLKPEMQASEDSRVVLFGLEGFCVIPGRLRIWFPIVALCTLHIVRRENVILERVIQGPVDPGCCTKNLPRKSLM